MLSAGRHTVVADELDVNGPYHVVLVRAEDETFVASGDLESCENWLASNGDTVADGHFEIRPALLDPESE